LCGTIIPGYKKRKAYAPNLLHPIIDDEYCAARECQVDKKRQPMPLTLDFLVKMSTVRHHNVRSIIKI